VTRDSHSLSAALWAELAKTDQVTPKELKKAK